MSKFTRKPRPAPAVEDFIAGSGPGPDRTDDSEPFDTISSDFKPDHPVFGQILAVLSQISDSIDKNSNPDRPRTMDNTVSSNIISSDTLSSDTVGYPWEHPRVRHDVQKVYNLRLPEPYLLKLKFIAGNTPGSMQRFCLDALLPAIDAEIERLTGKPG
ncbi:hypothetical protein MishRS11D_45210 (plasmid) [Methylomagnum ishizawai]|nr:hypothetical protein MishRS11D_45210 [Methylomagnum ishizawai]